MVTEAFELIDRFEKAVDANGYRTRDKHTEEEYRAAKSALDAALSAAEPAAWVYAPDLAKGSGGFGKEKGSVLMSLDGEWINVDTPLYPAPPAPSVVVKEAEPVAWRCKDFADGWILDHSERSAREYQRKTGCLIQPLYTTPPTISVAIENLSDEQIRHIADAKDVASCRARIRSALSAQVQDMAGSEGAKAIAVERRRQIEQEGWTPQRDDQYVNGELLQAAACYALHDGGVKDIPPPAWPWSDKWWKPSGVQRDLEKAGALIAAEIDRRLRAAAPAKQEGKP